MMTKISQKAYLYGITSLVTGVVPDCEGIGNPPQKVYAVPMGGVSVLVTYFTPEIIDISLDDAIRHVKVLEVVMRHSPVIPFKFGLMIESLDELKKMISARANDIKAELQRLTGKFETGLKAYWKKDFILKELANRYKDYASLLAQAQIDRQAAVELGQRVETVVNAYRQLMVEEIHPYLSAAAEDDRLDEPKSVEMLYNAAFLVSEVQEKELSRLIQKTGDKYVNKIEFHYTTQLPPYNFIRLNLGWGEQK